MLQGFSVPLTPQGLSPLVNLPPWHYSSDCLVVEYWADPDAVTALLPPNVVPDTKSNGRSFVWFLDWQFTGSNDELTDPARYQYREAFVLVEAIFEGQPINYCPYIFVDNDAAIARGWTQGFPKKLGSVFQTRSFSAPSAAAAPLAKGSRFGGSLAAHGERLVTARIQLEGKVENPAAIFTMSLTDDLAIVDVWEGTAELKIPEVQGEDLHSLAPQRVGRGYRLGMAYSVTDLRILKSYVR